jgi:hypothetical protein
VSVFNINDTNSKLENTKHTGRCKAFQTKDAVLDLHDCSLCVYLFAKA